MKRVQRKNFLAKLPPRTKLVARRTRWGNPFSLDQYSREESVQKYHEYLHNKLIENPNFLKPLQGYDLACYCSLKDLCHADILLMHLKNECPEFSLPKLEEFFNE